ncbi:uncharacterized protein LOC134254535, partial [Saccostrea cucullata]|uniref:uncharacterized protein LOC134254535 n=1 Tax=Saccostrea cuccullata TaxID=36930 RepID=UPI002ECFFC93
EQARTPTTDTTPTEGQETASSSATDRVPPPVASDVPPLPPSDKLKTISDRQTDVKQSEDQTAGDSPGGTSQTSDLRSPPPGCTEKQQTGVENQSTRKRKRSSGPCDPSKRQKTALFSPFEVEMQCLEQMFSTLTL